MEDMRQSVDRFFLLDGINAMMQEEDAPPRRTAIACGIYGVPEIFGKWY